MTQSDRNVVGEWTEGVVEVREGDNLFVEVDGVKIARRGLPHTPQEGTWVSIVTGWEVVDGPEFGSIIIRHDGVDVH